MGIVEYLSENSGAVAFATWQHFYLFLISMIISTIIGVALSILITSEGREKLGYFLLTVTGAAQAVPSVAVVALVFIFVGIGAKPAIISLVIYSLVPIVFNATSGILNVPPGTIEAAKGMGMTNTQILWKVKVPLAMTIIMSGIRSAATINIGTATVAAIIGGGGLGDIIFTGLKLNKPALIIVGAGLSALLAIVMDNVFLLVEKAVTPKGLEAQR
jgi:osmoprotectant transport system permease protein